MLELGDLGPQAWWQLILFSGTPHWPKCGLTEKEETDLRCPVNSIKLVMAPDSYGGYVCEPRTQEVETKDAQGITTVSRLAGVHSGFQASLD